MKTYKTIKPIKVHSKMFLGVGYHIISDNKNVYVEGYIGKLNRNYLKVLLDNDSIIEVNNDDRIELLVLPNKEYTNFVKLFKEADKNLPQYSNVISTIRTWVLNGKGSDAVNGTIEDDFQKDKESVLSKTTLRGGIMAKPGSVIKNRYSRHEPFVTNEMEIDWLNDETTLLPYGSRKSDYATMDEQIKIGTKIINQILSMSDCPYEFKKFFESKGFKQISDKLMDYLPDTDRFNMESKPFIPELFFKDFEKNQHHSKDKGLEFCHLDPWSEFATNVDNITIGSSRANRLQGGNPVWFIKKIFGFID